MNSHLRNLREPSLAPTLPSRGAGASRAMLIGFAMLFAAAMVVRGAEARFKDYEVEAGSLYNFTKFIEWPTNSFREASAPFVIGVAGNSPCLAVLEQVTKDRKIGGREIVIKVLDSPKAARGVQLLFLPATEDARLKEWLAATQGANILTVGESEAFFRQGGMINFLVEGDRVRFEVNIEPAEAAGLKISAQLQKMAKTVRRKS